MISTEITICCTVQTVAESKSNAQRLSIVLAAYLCVYEKTYLLFHIYLFRSFVIFFFFFFFSRRRRLPVACDRRYASSYGTVYCRSRYTVVHALSADWFTIYLSINIVSDTKTKCVWRACVWVWVCVQRAFERFPAKGNLNRVCLSFTLHLSHFPYRMCIDFNPIRRYTVFTKHSPDY